MRPKKGRVRDAIVILLADQPHNLTELAETLAVSKATVSYHLSNLEREGVIKVAQVKKLRSGLVSKHYSLAAGTHLVLPDPEEQEEAIAEITHHLETAMLKWTINREYPLGVEIQNLLFHVLRILRPLHTARRSELLRSIGYRIGSEAIPEMAEGGGLRGSLKSFVSLCREEKIAYAVLYDSDKRGKPIMNVVEILESRTRDPLLGYFIQGLVNGFLRAHVRRAYRAIALREQTENHVGWTYLITRRRGKQTRLPVKPKEMLAI
ncbi:MAG: ArsR family transcriptional regulator [Candidatus Geothermarchaeales archaeon]